MQGGQAGVLRLFCFGLVGFVGCWFSVWTWPPCFRWRRFLPVALCLHAGCLIHLPPSCALVHETGGSCHELLHVFA